MPDAQRTIAPGLTASEAARRLSIDGPNALPATRHRSGVRRFVDQLVHFFALMLWTAVVLAYVGGLPELSAAIALVIVLNAVFAFVQETRAGHAAERLRALLPQRVTVLRDERETLVSAAEVVRGDLLRLTAGDRGDAFPEGKVLAAASGAAFLAVVLCQMANAFPCRSSSRPAWRLRWTANRLLFPAVAAAAAVSVGSVWFPPVAHALDQAAPSAVGWLLAAAGPFLVLAVDGVSKARRTAPRPNTQEATS